MRRIQLKILRSTSTVWLFTLLIMVLVGQPREATATATATSAVTTAASSPLQAVTQSQSYRELWDSMSQMAALDQRLLNWSDLVEERQADGKVSIRLSFIAVRHFRPGHSAPPMWRSSQLGAEVGWFDAIRSYGEVRALVMFDESQSGWILIDFHYRPSLR
ncbi:MAG TPA: hypothetical protein PLZ57_08775 [Pseudobdellovibrionaceae bacterium]|nr:hypothetical protein [Pseudobdellovibrionaceae bacterium]